MSLNSLRATIFISIAFITLVFIQGCSDDKTDDINNNPTSRVQLILVDEPGDYLEVNVEIIDIQYKADGSGDSWMSFTPESGYPIYVDLTELISGNTLLLADEMIPSGILRQVRLVLGDNNTLLIEGEDDLIPLTTPSAQQSGLKLHLDEELEPGFSYTFILDWIVQESIVEAGNSGMYILKPVINVNTEVNSGSISGSVIEMIDDVETAIENVIVEVYTVGDVLVTDSLTDLNGEFLIQGLEAGIYVLKITRDGYLDYASLEINVTVGNILDAGIIELILE